MKAVHQICTIITITLSFPSDNIDHRYVTPQIKNTAHSTWSPLFLATFILFTYHFTAYQILHLISAQHTTLPILLCFHRDHYVSLDFSACCSLCSSNHRDQNSSSAFRQRDCLSRVRRASTSAANSSPWILLSLVRTLTLLVIFSFSPTTAKEHTQQLDIVQFTQYAATLTHRSHCAAEFMLECSLSHRKW